MGQRPDLTTPHWPHALLGLGTHRIGVGTRIEEELGQFEVSTSRRDHQRGAPVVRLRIDVGTL